MQPASPEDRSRLGRSFRYSARTWIRTLHSTRFLPLWRTFRPPKSTSQFHIRSPDKPRRSCSSASLRIHPRYPQRHAISAGIFAAVPVGKDIVTLYATGCGVLTVAALPQCQLPVSVTVNGQPAQVLYAGIAPGLVQGVDQINAQLPDGVTSGKLSIVLTVNNAASQPYSLILP